MDLEKIITVGILTVSDRSYQGVREDLSGPALQEECESQGWKVLVTAVVPDSEEQIASILFEWCDQKKLNLILTTGGTGLGPRDVTPDVTESILDKTLPGFSELMRKEGLKHTPLAPLSRAVCGLRGQSLLINLPGSPKGAVQSLQAIEYLIPHTQHVIQGGDHERLSLVPAGYETTS